MNKDDTIAQEAAEDNSTSQTQEKRYGKISSPLEGFDQKLTPEDLGEKSVLKFTVSDNERLKEQVANLEIFKEKYFYSLIEIARLIESAKSYTFTEALYALALVIGPLLIGVGIGKKDDSEILNYVIGGVLVSVAIIAKLVYKTHVKRGDVK
jgi:hypothetical protein